MLRHCTRVATRAVASAAAAQRPSLVVAMAPQTQMLCMSTMGNASRILTLNNLRDNAGAKRNRKRVGRGVGSGWGKTAGKGHKGQKPRRSTPIAGFEGGQTPFHRRQPKRGMSQNRGKSPMNELNLAKLQDWIDQGRLDPTQPINMRHLLESNVCGKIKHGVKLLASGADKLTSPVTIEVSRASRAAIEAVEAAGGRITTVYYNRLALRAHLKPYKFDILPRRARPPPKIIDYYRSFENRGELSPEMQLSQAPFTEEERGGFPTDPKAVHELLYPESE